MLLTYILYEGNDSLIATSIYKDTVSVLLNLPENLKLGIFWAITVVSIVALLYRQMKLHTNAYSKPSPNQTIKTNH